MKYFKHSLQLGLEWHCITLKISCTFDNTARLRMSLVPNKNTFQIRVQTVAIVGGLTKIQASEQVFSMLFQDLAYFC